MAAADQAYGLARAAPGITNAQVAGKAKLATMKQTCFVGGLLL